MHKVLIFTYDDISRDPRAQRQILWLRKDFDVTCICHVPDEKYGIKYIKYPNATYLREKGKFFCFFLNGLRHMSVAHQAGSLSPS